MTLLEILVQELETWPEGRECAYQSTTTSEAYFISQHEGAPKAITLCQIAPNRGIEHKVTRELAVLESGLFELAEHVMPVDAVLHNKLKEALASLPSKHCLKWCCLNSDNPKLSETH